MTQQEFDDKWSVKWVMLHIKMIDVLEINPEILARVPNKHLERYLHSSLLLEAYVKAQFIKNELDKRKQYETV